ncbi:MAG: DNA internalization-related competence protein ComEC/Rec2 [Gallionella sp.]|nr:DNA internalization-related competence protein ComEC/Rec2 [Gallionella sp.]MDD4958521.1 DNA internalization-related competence protein ComEC/Rec2 [Gallionella sp.]
MVLFTLFFTLGIWCLQQQADLPDFAWAWSLLAFPLVFWLKQVSMPHTLVRGLSVLLFLLFSTGLGFYHAAWQATQRINVSLPEAWQGKEIEIVGVVSNLPRVHDRGQGLMFDVEHTITPHVHVPPYLYLSTYQDANNPLPPFRAGERWQLTVRLKRPHGSSNPYGFDFERWALENQVRAVGYVYNKGLNIRADALAAGWNYRLLSWRAAILEKFQTTLGNAPYAGVLIALAIGEQSAIPSAQWQVFTRTGVNHLMSISGLHITMLASLAFALTYAMWRRSTRLTLLIPARKAAALVALLVALSYSLLAGYGVPAQRTVYMVGAVAVALWLNRQFSLAQILSIALLGVLIPDPWAVSSPGFWLSFSAVGLILYVTAYRIDSRSGLQQGDALRASPSYYDLANEEADSIWNRRMNTFHRVLREYLTVQWAMTIGLIPLLLAMFQQISIVSPIANAFAIPLVSFIVVPLTLLGAALPWDVPLWLAHIAMDIVMVGLDSLNSLPQAVWTQHAPPAWTIVVGMIGVVWILLPRGFPARWLGIIWLMPMFLNAPEPPDAGHARIVIFDVGQGLSVAVQTQQHALLYDTGADFSGDADSGNRVIVPNLRAMGIAELDTLVLSHDDNDHTGGADSVLQAMPVGWIRSSMPDDVLQADFNRTGTRCIDGQAWDWDGVHFTFLHPDASPSDKVHDNDQSCVLRISIGQQHILLVGDIEKLAEARLLNQHRAELAANLLVVPHHGSKSSSSDEFVAAVLPEYAVFTVGYRNRFGHPRPEITQRYSDAGAELLRSDEDGAILVNMNAQGLSLERHRQAHRRYWMQ